MEEEEEEEEDHEEEMEKREECSSIQQYPINATKIDTCDSRGVPLYLAQCLGS